ncbi:hypothetical protein MRB53_013814 [Persea americana]|uniref:Uncharacterized protein n=1 Tax=Persea americana TaxID=3435 RepID=A0ACC2K9B3_PERAE|nr:hypothetical protein MRB53_013814 [Persea americana]
MSIVWPSHSKANEATNTSTIKSSNSDRTIVIMLEFHNEFEVSAMQQLVTRESMASSPHHIDFNEDELDESYDPDNESDVFDNDFGLSDSEYANFQYETNDNAIINVEEAGLHTSLVGEEVGGEGQLTGYISQSSCHSLNTGSNSDGVSYHRVNGFDRNRHMDRPFISVGLPFKSVNDLRMALKQYAFATHLM